MPPNAVNASKNESRQSLWTRRRGMCLQEALSKSKQMGYFNQNQDVIFFMLILMLSQSFLFWLFPLNNLDPKNDVHHYLLWMSENLRHFCPIPHSSRASDYLKPTVASSLSAQLCMRHPHPLHINNVACALPISLSHTHTPLFVTLSSHCSYSNGVVYLWN